MQEITRRMVEELKRKTDAEKVIDVGVGVELDFMIGKDRFRTVLNEVLKDHKYTVKFIPVNIDGDIPTTMRVMALSDVDFKTLKEKAQKLFDERLKKFTA